MHGDKNGGCRASKLTQYFKHLTQQQTSVIKIWPNLDPSLVLSISAE